MQHLIPPALESHVLSPLCAGRSTSERWLLGDPPRPLPSSGAVRAGAGAMPGLIGPAGLVWEEEEEEGLPLHLLLAWEREYLPLAPQSHKVQHLS